MDIPEFFQGPAYYDQSQFTQESRRLSDVKSSFVDEFLNYPNDDGLVAPADDDHDGDGDGGVFEDHMVVAGAGGGAVTGTSTHESTFLDNTSCNSTGSTGLYPFGGGGDIAGCRNFTDAHFSTELCVPYDDLAELEWVSHFAEESFSCEDLQNMHLISGIESPNNNNNEFQPEPNRATSTSISTTIFRPEMAVPAKARSKRSRAPPCNWTSRLLAVTPSPTSSTTTTTTTTNDQMTLAVLSSSESIGSSLEKKAIKATFKKKESARNGIVSNNEGRRCLHCATDQTPQWRTGPMGPKTLCNACGVRYKSGRLLPEYRPAASPTFVLTKHSNSHRKVMELRRQNEVSTVHQHHHQQQFLHQNMMFNVANVDDFLIHQHMGPDFRQLI